MTDDRDRVTITMEASTKKLIDDLRAREDRSNFLEALIKSVLDSNAFYKQLKRAHALTENEDLFDTVHELIDVGVKELLKRG